MTIRHLPGATRRGGIARSAANDRVLGDPVDRGRDLLRALGPRNRRPDSNPRFRARDDTITVPQATAATGWRPWIACC